MFHLPVKGRVKSAQKTSWSSAHSLSGLYYSLSSMVTRLIFTAGALGLFGSRGGMDMSTSRPSKTQPKTLCLLSKCGVGVCVMKNCEPLVFGPAFAIDRIPCLSCFKLG